MPCPIHGVRYSPIVQDAAVAAAGCDVPADNGRPQSADSAFEGQSLYEPDGHGVPAVDTVLTPGATGELYVQLGTTCTPVSPPAHDLYATVVIDDAAAAIAAAGVTAAGTDNPIALSYWFDELTQQGPAEVVPSLVPIARQDSNVDEEVDGSAVTATTLDGAGPACLTDDVPTELRSSRSSVTSVLEAFTRDERLVRGMPRAHTIRCDSSADEDVDDAGVITFSQLGDNTLL